MHSESGLVVTLQASISPSEDPSKVLASLKNILGGSPFEKIEDNAHVRLEAVGRKSLDRFHEQLRDRRVRGAARKRLVAGTQGRRTTVMLNRQAAYGGIVALCDREDESPLGPIWLTIESDDLADIIQWLTDFPQE